MDRSGVEGFGFAVRLLPSETQGNPEIESLWFDGDRNFAQIELWFRSIVPVLLNGLVTGFRRPQTKFQ